MVSSTKLGSSTLKNYSECSECEEIYEFDTRWPQFEKAVGAVEFKFFLNYPLLEESSSTTLQNVQKTRFSIIRQKNIIILVKI